MKRAYRKNRIAQMSSSKRSWEAPLKWANNRNVYCSNTRLPQAELSELRVRGSELRHLWGEGRQFELSLPPAALLARRITYLLFSSGGQMASAELTAVYGGAAVRRRREDASVDTEPRPERGLRSWEARVRLLLQLAQRLMLLAGRRGARVAVAASIGARVRC